jgi:hypothetical protein
MAAARCAIRLAAAEAHGARLSTSAVLPVTPFEALNLQPPTSTRRYAVNDIKAAYKRMALRVHPDVAGGDQRVFVLAQKAAKILEANPNDITSWCGTEDFPGSCTRPKPASYSPKRESGEPTAASSHWHATQHQHQQQQQQRATYRQPADASSGEQQVKHEAEAMHEHNAHYARHDRWRTHLHDEQQRQRRHDRESANATVDEDYPGHFGTVDEQMRPGPHPPHRPSGAYQSTSHNRHFVANVVAHYWAWQEGRLREFLTYERLRRQLVSEAIREQEATEGMAARAEGFEEYRMPTYQSYVLGREGYDKMVTFNTVLLNVICWWALGLFFWMEIEYKRLGR